MKKEILIENLNYLIKASTVRFVGVFTLIFVFPFFSLAYLLKVFLMQFKHYADNVFRYPLCSYDTWSYVLLQKPIREALYRTAVPHQNWLLKLIPWHYSDKTELIFDIARGCVIDFVEKERCFDRIDFNFYTHKEFGEELREQYWVIKDALPKLEKELEFVGNLISDNTEMVVSKNDNAVRFITTCDELKYESLAKKYNEIEIKIYNLRQNLVSFVAKHYSRMWT